MISVIQNVHCSFISTQTKESNILHIFGIVFDNLAGFTKDACVSLLLGQLRHSTTREGVAYVTKRCEM